MKFRSSFIRIIVITACLGLLIIFTGHSFPETEHNQIPTPDAASCRQDEFILDTDFVSIPGAGSQVSPDIAFDGTNYLMVWVDHRNRYAQVYGARIDQQGILLDTAAIPIATASDGAYNPAVCFDGANYLVAWSNKKETRDTSTIFFGDDYQIWGTMVSPAGTVLDTNGFQISFGSCRPMHVKVASDGNNCLVAWYEYYCWGFTSGTRVTSAGRVIDSPSVYLGRVHSGMDCCRDYPGLCFDGTNYLLVGNYGGGIRGVRITPDLQILDSIPFPISHQISSVHPDIAFDGANYLVVWEDRELYTPTIYGARVNQSGAVIDSPPFRISMPNASKYALARLPAVTYGGSSYFVTWQDRRDRGYLNIYGARVATTGTILDPQGIPITQDFDHPHDQNCNPAAASGATNYFAVWQDGHNDTIQSKSYDIDGARITHDGVLLDPDKIEYKAQSPGHQHDPAACFNGTNYLVVWSDRHHGPFPELFSRIYGMRLGPSGAALDTAFAIAPVFGSQIYPRVSFNGDNYLVAWHEISDRDPLSWNHICCARVAGDGAVIDTAAILLADVWGFQTAPAIGFDGVNHLVAWFNDNCVFCARVTADGIVLDTGGVIVAVDQYMVGAGWSPGVTFDGENYLIVWSHTEYPTWDHYFDIYGARVTPDGSVVDTVPLVISNANRHQLHPCVSFDGANFFVVWDDDRNSVPFYDDTDIYGARVSPNGVVLDPSGIPICDLPETQEYPVVYYNGQNHVVVWEDRRGFPASEVDLYGAWIDPGGNIVANFPLVTAPGDQDEPFLAGGQNGATFLTYSGWAYSCDNKPVYAVRTWGKFLPMTPVFENCAGLEGPREPLLQVLPNPFTRRTEINVAASSEDAVTIYDVTGRLVHRIGLSGKLSAGAFSFTWTGEDRFGKKLPAGVYFVRLETARGCPVIKVVMLK